MNRIRLAVAAIMLIAVCGLSSIATAAGVAAPASDTWPTPTLVPVPDSVAGVSQPIMQLDGWRSLQNPTGEFWGDSVDTSTWTAGGGGRGPRGGGGGGPTTNRSGDNPYTAAFRTTAAIPADWANKRIVIRFDGVADGAKLWVNAKPVREHYGSLVPWCADITGFIEPGKTASITLGVDERREGLNLYVRGGGIERPVTLMALPDYYISRLHAETTFDPQYKNATLHVWLNQFEGAPSGILPDVKVKIWLKDPAGNDVPLLGSTVGFSFDQVFDFSVPSAIKWDAEHPNLYTLSANLVSGDNKPLENISRKIGLRQIEVRGNQMFVNGQEIKLRGVWGGNTVAQLKEMNANHTRQKWVTEEFLNDADRLGLYVLDENPVDFAKYGAEADPAYAHEWLNLIADLVERDRDHPSVIMWGLGNESFSGPNIVNEFKYVQAIDKQRPSIFSWANRVPSDQPIPYSVSSSHYPNLADPATSLADFTVAKWHSPSLPMQRDPKPVMPVLHDEYAHVVQNRALIDRDPNTRAFWGESLRRFWDKMFVTQGALGGDIFGLTGGFGATHNETFMVRKAYSPIRISSDPLPNPGAGQALSVPVKNWFDHTNLNELKIDWAVGDDQGTIDSPDLAPHQSRMLNLAPRAWKSGDQLSLTFKLANGTVVDDFLLSIAPSLPSLPTAQGPAPALQNDGSKVVITGDHFKVVFDRYRGLIDNASYDGKTVLIDGPFLNLLGSGLSYPEWWCDHFDARIEGSEAVITMKGNYAIIQAEFQVRIDGQGLLTTKYTVDYVPGNPPPSTYSPWDATSMGGCSEVGASYMLPSTASTLTWNRKGLYGAYPADHIGRPQGTAKKGTDDFRGTKEYIYTASVDAGTGAAATALSDGRDAVRVLADPGGRSMPAGIRLCINNEWNYPDIGLGNWCKPAINVTKGYTGTVYLKLGSTNP